MDQTLIDGRMKIRHLVLALAIAEHGSIVRAAHHLHITQPVVTRGLKELEQLLGVELFDRGPKGVTPTVFAVAFLEHARAILAHLRQASQHVSELSNATAGTVTVATHLAGANLLLPRAIAMLKSSHPGVLVVVREGTPDKLDADLMSGDVDLIVGRQGQLSFEAPVRQVDLYEEPFRIVARQDHPVLLTSDPQLSELRQFPWILPLKQTSLRRELEDLFRQQAVVLPEERIECTAPLTVRTIIVETDYLAVLPETLALAEPQLAVVPTPLAGVSQKIVATLAAEYSPSPSTALMLECLKEIGAQMGRTPTPDSVQDSPKKSPSGMSI
ncbi:DNA-binding transcriptional LysR family regulator [Arthrobacter pascens]|uniref:LysR substrate-binding domain-containing protein n=1 Tax=Arthrobacter pascens TaxID=1677 RepID=UPI0027846674|nr:LysR substrate-binding domain-containing protein [Arthrobacter pascens]MDQ0634321.1 DNA-binding transcriptional LysR family regulator [Arthrobacter pascens]